MSSVESTALILRVLKTHEDVFRAQNAAIESLTNVVQERLEYEAALTVACGTLFAELAHATGMELGQFDILLTRTLSGVEEAYNGAKGAILAADRMRSIAEALHSHYREKG